MPKEDGTVEAKMAGMAAGLFSLFALTPDFLTESQINVVAGAGFDINFTPSIRIIIPASGSLSSRRPSLEHAGFFITG